ncbi:hypothetical protein SISSUDRAFT_1035903 [Sistotremastrum suecicum HHB10207 ss-3]|uniref:BHLH domain-containing protein n=1 Tax=Sistotremastrum suecicum HHB10207 ss-3 TaxID=1314776 RepID=A0A166A5C7_9AGAM|nr:hypothetical protein SISSUDRAFT_1035903 [Sistotremastrum suecicum HHB10207 ss-3]
MPSANPNPHRRDIERKSRDKRSDALELVIQSLIDRGVLNPDHRISQADVLLVAEETLSDLSNELEESRAEIRHLTGVVMKIQQDMIAYSAPPIARTHFKGVYPRFVETLYRHSPVAGDLRVEWVDEAVFLAVLE